MALVTHQLDASETQETSRTLRYLLKDHLGSINLITDIYGMPEEQLAFDPWGKRRDETVWAAQADLTTWLKSRKPITSRGFTGHEMIDGADVIHMNGRIYDSHIARFLQSDPLIQDPTVSGSLNRYSYVWNNPLNTTDPSGYAGFKQDQEEQKRAETRTCDADACYYRDANGNWVSGGFGSKMDLSGGSQAATRSAGGGGTLENGASADASVTTEVNAGQSASPPKGAGASLAGVAIAGGATLANSAAAIEEVVVTGSRIARSFAWNAQVTSLISSLGTELRALAVLGGRYATGIVGGLLIPDNMFGEDFGCHSSMVTCVIDGKVVDASTGLPYEGGMVSSGGGADPNDPDDPSNKGGDDVNWKSTKQFGHTFKTHGQGPKVLRSLTGRAASGHPTQGQWLNNQKAAQHLHSLRGRLSVGENTINIPNGLGHVVNSRGVTTSTNMARVIVRSDGTIKTAFPILP